MRNVKLLFVCWMIGACTLFSCSDLFAESSNLEEKQENSFVFTPHLTFEYQGQVISPTRSELRRLLRRDQELEERINSAFGVNSLVLTRSSSRMKLNRGILKEDIALLKTLDSFNMWQKDLLGDGVLRYVESCSREVKEKSLWEKICFWCSDSVDIPAPTQQCSKKGNQKDSIVQLPVLVSIETIEKSLSKKLRSEDLFSESGGVGIKARVRLDKYIKNKAKIAKCQGTYATKKGIADGKYEAWVKSCQLIFFAKKRRQCRDRAGHDHNSALKSAKDYLNNCKDKYSEKVKVLEAKIVKTGGKNIRFNTTIRAIDKTKLTFKGDKWKVQTKVKIRLRVDSRLKSFEEIFGSEIGRHLRQALDGNGVFACDIIADVKVKGSVGLGEKLKVNAKADKAVVSFDNVCGVGDLPIYGEVLQLIRSGRINHKIRDMVNENIDESLAGINLEKYALLASGAVEKVDFYGNAGEASVQVKEIQYTSPQGVYIKKEVPRNTLEMLKKKPRKYVVENMLKFGVGIRFRPEVTLGRDAKADGYNSDGNDKSNTNVLISKVDAIEDGMLDLNIVGQASLKN